MQTNPITVRHLLSRQSVLKRIPFSGSTLWRAIAAGRFPRPIRLGKRRVAWVECEIAEWLAARMEERGSTRLSDPSSSSTIDQIGDAI
jgi:prophage regulatory protein